MPTLLVKRQA